MLLSSLAVSLLCVWLLGCAGKPERITRKECEDAQKQLATLRMEAGERTSKLSEAEREKHRSQFAIISKDSLDNCQENQDRAWARCVEASETLRGALGCE